MLKILTIPEYCRLMNISRQAAYENKAHRSKMITLPVFVEHEGKKIEIEKRMFVLMEEKLGEIR
jgi:hypothetical protein